MKILSITKPAGLLVLAVALNATFIGAPAFSQSASNQGTTSGTSTGSGQANTLTGGAEAAPTDQATPAPSSGTGGTSSMSGSSGKANTLTGGAEGAPTDQATPSSTTGQRPSGASPGRSPDSNDKGMYPSPKTQPAR